MINHVHILATPAKPGALGTMMQSLGRRYVRYVNATYKRSGTLWEGRYKVGAVDAEDYLLRVYRYIELNPVLARVNRVPTKNWRSPTLRRLAGRTRNSARRLHALVQRRSIRTCIRTALLLASPEACWPLRPLHSAPTTIPRVRCVW